MVSFHADALRQVPRAPVPTLWVGWWTNLKRWTQGILPRPSRPFEDKRHGA